MRFITIQPHAWPLQVIRGLLAVNTYVIVVEHDLSVLDYLSDFICCLYGKPGAYGVVTLPFSVREGINIFLAGFVPTENLRFREESLSFKVRHATSPGMHSTPASALLLKETEKKCHLPFLFDLNTLSHAFHALHPCQVTDTAVEGDEGLKKFLRYKYPAMTKTQGGFKLTVEAGEFTDSEIIVMLGENGTGKTTFIRMLAGMLKPDDAFTEVDEFRVSYKPQKISPKFTSTVSIELCLFCGTHAHPSLCSLFCRSAAALAV